MGIAATQKELDQNLDAMQALHIGKSKWGNLKVFYRAMIVCGNKTMKQICDDNEFTWMKPSMMHALKEAIEEWKETNEAGKLSKKELRKLVAMPKSFNWFLTINKNKFWK